MGSEKMKEGIGAQQAFGRERHEGQKIAEQVGRLLGCHEGSAAARAKLLRPCRQRRHRSAAQSDGGPAQGGKKAYAVGEDRTGEITGLQVRPAGCQHGPCRVEAGPVCRCHALRIGDGRFFRIVATCIIIMRKVEIDDSIARSHGQTSVSFQRSALLAGTGTRRLCRIPVCRCQPPKRCVLSPTSSGAISFIDARVWCRALPSFTRGRPGSRSDFTYWMPSAHRGWHAPPPTM